MVGLFYKKSSSSGSDYEVVLADPAEEVACKAELRCRRIQVRDVATVGHFTIHLDDPIEWVDVGAVIYGEIIGDGDAQGGDT